jgi:hypothetical protein
MKKPMQILDLMLDLESLGNGGSPVIIQIAAIPFNIETGEVFSDEFDRLINPISCVKLGLKVNGQTVEWWLNQDKHVIEKVFVKAIQEGLEIKDVLLEFNKFINDLKVKHKVKDIRVYSNGILADSRWLNDAYALAGLTPAWKYYEDSDVRTLVDMGKRLLNFDPKRDMPFEGDKHVARQDVLHQIKYCSKIYEELQKLTKTKIRKKHE